MSEGCPTRNFIDFGCLVVKILLVKNCLTFFGTLNIFEYTEKLCSLC